MQLTCVKVCSSFQFVVATLTMRHICKVVMLPLSLGNSSLMIIIWLTPLMAPRSLLKLFTVLTVYQVWVFPGVRIWVQRYQISLNSFANFLIYKNKHYVTEQHQVAISYRHKKVTKVESRLSKKGKFVNLFLSYRLIFSISYTIVQLKLMYSFKTHTDSPALGNFTTICN